MHRSLSKTPTFLIFLMLVNSGVAAAQTGDNSPQTRISGYVKDVEGRPVRIAVDFETPDLGTIGGVLTDENGYYEKTVTKTLQYIVSVNPVDNKYIGNYSFASGYLQQKKLVAWTGYDLKVDFTVNYGGTIWLRAYDISGNELYRKDFPDPSFAGAFPVGVFPSGQSIQANYNEDPIYWVHLKGSKYNTACLLLPPDTAVALWMFWRLPEVGGTFLSADNEGMGFTVRRGEFSTINLIHEFAKTEYRKTAERQRTLVDDYVFSTSIPTWLDNAKQNLAQAEEYKESGNQGKSAMLSYAALVNTVKAREQIVFEKAQQDIERLRKRNVTVTLVEDGNPVSNATVEFAQTSHDFVLAAGWWGRPNRILREVGFEYAWPESWWGIVEKTDGDYDFAYLDSTIDALHRAGFGTAMQQGLSFTPSYPPAVPDFALSMNASELSLQAYQYSYDVLKRYRGRIPVYNIFNEPDIDQVFDLTQNQFIDIINASGSGAKKADPNTIRYVNISIPMFNGLSLNPIRYRLAYDMYGNPLPDVNSYASPFSSGSEVAMTLARREAAFDAIGLELYYGVVLPPVDASLLYDMLDEYSSLGRPIFISELSYATLDDYPNLDKWWERYGGWHQGYTDEAQADWARYAMTIAFSKPSVRGIQWVSVLDGPPEYDFVGIGLFHQDGVTPRPIVYAIEDLVKSWTTNGSGNTDSNGVLHFRGFPGDYSLNEKLNGHEAISTRIHVAEAANNRFIIDLKHPKPYYEPALDTTKPTANAGLDETANEGALVTFNGSASADENGIVTYTWTFSDMTPRTLNGKNPTYTFATPGVYTVTLTVADPAGNSATDTVVITVLDIAKPVASAGQDQTVDPGTTVAFDGARSTDNVGIVGYEWNFGDGKTGTGKAVTHAYENVGTYTVTLAVKDSAGNTASDSLTITVRSEEAPPPLGEAFPMWMIGGAIAAVGVVVATRLLLRKREKRNNGLVQRQA